MDAGATRLDERAVPARRWVESRLRRVVVSRLRRQAAPGGEGALILSGEICCKVATLSAYCVRQLIVPSAQHPGIEAANAFTNPATVPCQENTDDSIRPSARIPGDPCAGFPVVDVPRRHRHQPTRSRHL